jgi:general stress protein YciG
MTTTKKKPRGFAAMSPEKRIEMARKGGTAASKGNGHKFTSAEAREAGRKGGIACGANRAHMAEIGRRGAEARYRGSATNLLPENDEREMGQDDDRAGAGNED